MYNTNTSNLDIKTKDKLFFETLSGYLDKRLSLTTNLANMSAIIKAFFPELNWAGFYLFDGEQLYLGPFQGLPACTEIAIGRGVCGTSAETKKSILVPDTDLFPGHIVCDQFSRSELVIPIVKFDNLIGVLDLDSPTVGYFTESDRIRYELAVNLLIDII
ncbi:MAG: GAF domain-containing protein [Bacilli bacterium]|nr:GAF domain-containing protein [Bacilli bacterium]MBN2695949.1 GAF domain-containing protein [Bacilli bacterium]